MTPNTKTYLIKDPGGYILPIIIGIASVFLGISIYTFSLNIYIDELMYGMVFTISLLSILLFNMTCSVVKSWIWYYMLWAVLINCVSMYMSIYTGKPIIASLSSLFVSTVFVRDSCILLKKYRIVGWQNLMVISVLGVLFPLIFMMNRKVIALSFIIMGFVMICLFVKLKRRKINYTLFK
ncbi:hypothetical protein ATB96_17565 [Elizabethkingia ursingii]|nr:hypothetical protein ATB96_17565 [Elizabethkingia ursingii]